MTTLLAFAIYRHGPRCLRAWAVHHRIERGLTQWVKRAWFHWEWLTSSDGTGYGDWLFIRLPCWSLWFENDRDGARWDQWTLCWSCKVGWTLERFSD